MKSMIWGICWLTAAGFGLWAQGGPASPAFDVASVKPNRMGRAGGEGSRTQKMNTEPGVLNMRNFSLKSCVQWAYNVKDYQVSGPDWINAERFDIVAKAPGPAGDSEMRPMLQKLLADRFQLAVHRETRELPIYAMVVGKNGSKLKPAAGEGESSAVPTKSAGRLAISLHLTTMPEFAEMISNPLQRPVVDMTGLTGRYDFSLDLTPYLNRDTKPGEGGEGGPRGIEESGVTTAIMMALQEELGLKLEAKKNVVDMIVIDRALKVPTDN